MVNIKVTPRKEYGTPFTVLGNVFVFIQDHGIDVLYELTGKTVVGQVDKPSDVAELVSIGYSGSIRIASTVDVYVEGELIQTIDHVLGVRESKRLKNLENYDIVVRNSTY